MKKHAPLITSVISCVLAALCLIQVISLKNEVTNLRSNTNFDLSHISNSINNIYSNVSNMLEEEANLLSVSEWEYGNIDVDSKTAEVIWTIIPKVYNPDVTTATLFCNGQEFPLTYENNQYVATVPAPLFEECHFSHVILNDNGTIRTQKIDWYITPRYEALPTVYTNYSGSSTGTLNKNTQEYTWVTSGSIDININTYRKDFEIRSIEIVEVLDGVEIGRIPVDISKAGQMQYQALAEKTGNAVPEGQTSGIETESGSMLYNDSAYFSYFLNKTYQIPYGSMLLLYVDVVDGYGLRHRALADCTALTEDGDLDNYRSEPFQMYIYAETVAIYDQNDNLLYTVDTSLFQ